MNCPSCNALITGKPAADGSTHYACAQCGWGQDQTPAGGGGEKGGKADLFWLKFAFLWLVTMVVLVGPYVGLRYAAIYIGGEAGVGELEQRFVAGLNVHYAWVMAVYLAVCWTLTPRYDRDNMGVFGAGRYANPAVTREQHANRLLAGIASFVAPGKMVLMTVAVTYRLVRYGRER